MKIIEDPIPLLFGENLKNCFQPYFILNIGSAFQLYIRAIFNTAAALIRSRQNPPIMHESPACYCIQRFSRTFAPLPHQKSGGRKREEGESPALKIKIRGGHRQASEVGMDKHQRWAFKIKLQDVRTPTIPLLCCVHKRQ